MKSKECMKCGHSKARHEIQYQGFCLGADAPGGWCDCDKFKATKCEKHPRYKVLRKPIAERVK